MTTTENPDDGERDDERDRLDKALRDLAAALNRLDVVSRRDDETR